MRQRSTHRWLRVALVSALPLAAVIGGPASVALATTAPATAVMSPASDAVEVSSEARALRASTSSMIQRYIDDYGGRLTAAEAARLPQYKDTAQRNLTSVVVTTRRLATLVGQGAPRRDVVAAGRAAQRAHARARSVAIESYEQARALLEPKLSWVEGLQALRDYDEMLSRFDDVGARIDGVVRSYRGA